MNLELNKINHIEGVIEVPADKSITHRAVILSSLASGTSQIKNYLPSDDCLRTINAFRQLGVEIKQNKDTLVITGTGLYLQKPGDEIYAGNSGTTARLLSGILCSQNFSSKITGDESLAKRPMDRIIKPLTLMGANIESNNLKLPLLFKQSKLKAINYVCDKSSAQIKSSVLLAGLYALGTTTYSEPLKSRNHSEIMLKAYGANINVSGNVISITQSEKLNPQNITIVSDISSAAFFIVAALIIPNSKIKIKNVGINPTRDGIITALQQMGADIKLSNIKEICGEKVCDMDVKYSKLTAINLDKNLIPEMIDEIPIFALAASRANGITKITNAKELRVKETDRITAIKTEFSKLGIEVEELDDGLIINGNQKIKGTKVNSHNDHRIAMTLAIAALIAQGKTTIENAQCVNISFPNFYERLKEICR